MAYLQSSLLSPYPAGNFDYVPVNKEVSFDQGDTQCVDIQIINDGLTEGDEVFAVDLMNGNTILTFASVIIHDCKCTKNCQLIL